MSQSKPVSVVAPPIITERAGRSRLAPAAAAGMVGLALGGLLVGFQPTGADPDLLYRPIKAELARALASGTLPFWSDRLGLGVPLVAESHAAAFYPPNWILYRALNVDLAYRLAMWAHNVALAVGLYLYARALTHSPWGAALTAVAFPLCASVAIHAGHEPFYHAFAWLPFILLAAENYAATGRRAALAAIALLWGVQLTIGHFQLQVWTAGLAWFIGTWRILAHGWPRQRILGLLSAFAWGLGIAMVQLALTAELTFSTGFARTTAQRAIMAFPVIQWLQAVVPSFFVRLAGGAADPFWANQATTGGESAFAIGAIPFVLAFVGWTRQERHPDPLAPWKCIAVVSACLACLPRLAPPIYEALLHVPVLGWFRAPARFTLLTSLALTIIAGSALSRHTSAARFRTGTRRAIVAAAVGFVGVAVLASSQTFRASLVPSTIPWRIAGAFLTWLLALGALWLWRTGRTGGWLPVTFTLIELTVLFFLSSQPWQRPPFTPSESPMLRKLNELSDVGLVAGLLEDLPVRARLTAAYPYLGISAPPPIYLLEPTRSPDAFALAERARWLRRFGVTHGVWPSGEAIAAAETIFEDNDPVLDFYLSGTLPSVPRRWKIVRYPPANAPAWVATHAEHTEWAGGAAWVELFSRLSIADEADLAFYERQDAPPDPKEPRATSARVVSYDGNTAIVEHDGACDLILRRTWFPGWTARVNGTPPARVHRANGGLQAVPLRGRGTTRVELAYRPTWLVPAAILSFAATGAALVVIAIPRALVRRPQVPSLQS